MLRITTTVLYGAPSMLLNLNEGLINDLDLLELRGERKTVDSGWLFVLSFSRTKKNMKEIWLRSRSNKRPRHHVPPTSIVASRNFRSLLASERNLGRRSK